MSLLTEINGEGVPSGHRSGEGGFKSVRNEEIGQVYTLIPSKLVSFVVTIKK
jgi:hypothetical protein